jgi:TetR/AcrR family transcriptional repressor of nem operon
VTERPVPPRRLTAKGQLTRDRIVQAAADLIARRGAAGTSIEAVRHAASVSGSQIAHYFPTKQRLVRAVIARQTDLVLRALPGFRRGCTTLNELDAWARSVVAHYEADNMAATYLMGRLAAELAESDNEVRADLAICFDRWLDCLTQGIRGMQDRGEIRADADADELAVTLLSMVEGGLLLARTNQDVRLLKTALSMALDRIRSLLT